MRGMSPSIALHRVRAWANYLSWRLGWPAWFGAIALAGAIVFYLGVTLPLAGARNRLMVEIDSLEQARQPGISATRAADRSAALLSSLPDRHTVGNELAGLHRTARRWNLDLAEGEYRLESAAGAAIARYHIHYPVTGSYSDIRRFVSGSLAASHALSLDKIRFSRESIDAAQIEADIHFSLYLGTGS